MSATSVATDSLAEIATLRIELIDSDPLIWRELEVPTAITLKVLHDIVQATMNWMDYHLWQFVIDGQTYGLPMEDDWEMPPRKIASRVRLRDVLSSDTTEIAYTYDFGDSWEHRLIVSNVRQGTPRIGYPRFVSGERNGPPEDCGGIPGFYDKLQARDDPAHSEHAEISQWLGGYDPDELEEMPIRYALGRIAGRHNAAATRIRKSTKS
jgi:hypothetical protein